jgi:putative nucleotidyltransferase with HDIG domain
MELLHTQAGLDPEVERLLSDLEPRKRTRLSGRELTANSVLAVVFIALEALLLAIDRPPAPDWGPAIALTLGYAAAYRVHFYVGSGKAVPTQLFLVPLLFAAPPALVPVFVVVGLLLGRLPDVIAGREHPARLFFAVVDAGYAIAPAAVFVVAGITGPDWADWPVWVAAIVAQIVWDAAGAVVGERLTAGVAPRLQLALLGWVQVVDVLLSVVGLLAAFAADESPYAPLLLLAVLGLLDVFARERRARIDQAIEMSRTYHRTALLLGDVIEADDAYTGSHSRGVVALSLAVARELGLSERDRRLCELGALLHDVGKIHVPDAILNKPASLSEAEWVVMRGHTLTGQRMLDRVGGFLREVGVVVRSSHEHWDGSGYPDGLVGEQIPIAARVVTACDAYSAITTDRVYRPARSTEVAVEELRRCSGRQFDPAVVDALVRIVGLWGALVTPPRSAMHPEPDAVQPAAGAA